MHLQIITPEKILLEGEAEMVTMPGAEGDFGILPGHMPLISTLIAGEVVINKKSGGEERIAITGGVAEVTAERCILLVETKEAA